MTARRAKRGWRGALRVGLAAVWILAGCSRHDPDASATEATAASNAPTGDVLRDQCRWMPVATVAAILQANGADTVTESSVGAGGMCSYLHVPEPGQYRTRLLIDFSRLATVAAARAQMRSRRNDFIRRGHPVTEIPGLGDEAFAAQAEGTEGLKLRVGTIVGQINLQVADQPPLQLRAATVALGRAIAARLPH